MGIYCNKKSRVSVGTRPEPERGAPGASSPISYGNRLAAERLKSLRFAPKET